MSSKELKEKRQHESRNRHDRKQASRIERDRLLHNENERHIAASAAIWDKWRKGDIPPASTRTLSVPSKLHLKPRKSRAKR